MRLETATALPYPVPVQIDVEVIYGVNSKTDAEFYPAHVEEGLLERRSF